MIVASHRNSPCRSITYCRWISPIKPSIHLLIDMQTDLISSFWPISIISSAINLSFSLTMTLPSCLRLWVAQQQEPSSTPCSLKPLVLPVTNDAHSFVLWAGEGKKKTSSETNLHVLFGHSGHVWLKKLNNPATFFMPMLHLSHQSSSLRSSPLVYPFSFSCPSLPTALLPSVSHHSSIIALFFQPSVLAFSISFQRYSFLVWLPVSDVSSRTKLVAKH